MEFRMGINHGNADMLSRSTCDTCTQCLTQHEDPKTEKMKTRQLATMIETKGATANIRKVKNKTLANITNITSIIYFKFIVVLIFPSVNY